MNPQLRDVAARDDLAAEGAAKNRVAVVERRVRRDIRVARELFAEEGVEIDLRGVPLAIRIVVPFQFGDISEELIRFLRPSDFAQKRALVANLRPNDRAPHPLFRFRKPRDLLLQPLRRVVISMEGNDFHLRGMVVSAEDDLHVPLRQFREKVRRHRDVLTFDDQDGDFVDKKSGRLRVSHHHVIHFEIEFASFRNNDCSPAHNHSKMFSLCDSNNPAHDRSIMRTS